MGFEFQDKASVEDVILEALPLVLDDGLRADITYHFLTREQDAEKWFLNTDLVADAAATFIVAGQVIRADKLVSGNNSSGFFEKATKYGVMRAATAVSPDKLIILADKYGLLAEKKRLRIKEHAGFDTSLLGEIWNGMVQFDELDDPSNARTAAAYILNRRQSVLASPGSVSMTNEADHLEASIFFDLNRAGANQMRYNLGIHLGRFDEAARGCIALPTRHEAMSKLYRIVNSRDFTL